MAKAILNQEEAAERMEELKVRKVECCRGDAVDLLCEVLESRNFIKMVAIFKSVPKWYT